MVKVNEVNFKMGMKNNRTGRIVIFILIITSLFLLTGCTDKPQKTPPPGDEVEGIEFYDVKVQTPEFISYYYSITLTPEQEKVMEDALTPIPAPCCSEYTMYTCCCPCNLAKSVWGLSSYLITEHNYNADQVNAAVSKWISFTNEEGYAGNACSLGRCNYPFREDGCGGMGDEPIV